MRIFQSRSKKTEATQFYVQPSQKPATGTGVAIAVLVKNEAASIAEWLRFHSAAGVDAFILYNDGCTDDTIALARQILPPGTLEVIPWCQRLQDAKNGKALHNQGLAFAHAVANFGSDFRWMGFIDIDEFLFPTKADSIKDVLSRLDHVDNILLPWQMFGRQGFETTPDKVIPNYLHRLRDPYQTVEKGVFNFKCLVNPSKVTKAYVHGFETNGNKTIWNSCGQEFQFGQHKEPGFHDRSDLQLNHYYLKSNAQLEEKTNKGSIGDSTFTKHFKRTDDRQDMLLRRVLEIERDTIEDHSIIEFCQRMSFDIN